MSGRGAGDVQARGAGEEDLEEDLVSPAWVEAHLDGPDVAIVDMRWREDGSGRALFEAGHLPGAVHCDWSTDLVEPDAPVAFTLAGPERFAARMERLGVGDGTVAVAYADRLGSGPFRLWWACRGYGHDQVRILDGGLDRWMLEGRPIVRGPEAARAGVDWTARPGEPLSASAEDVARGEVDPSVVVLDCRPPDQFRGEAVWFETGPWPADPDGIARTPRGEFRAGRVPWASNVPIASLYRDDLTMKSPHELRGLFADAGVAHGVRVITYCGVGISASAVLFALRRAGMEDLGMYDASWEEWGRDPARPVVRDT